MLVNLGNRAWKNSTSLETSVALIIVQLGVGSLDKFNESNSFVNNAHNLCRFSSTVDKSMHKNNLFKSNDFATRIVQF